MNLKHLLITAVCAAAALSASAQGQGYLDGVDYFKVEQYDNAREILERTLNDGSTDKATEIGRASCRERVCQYV